MANTGLSLGEHWETFIKNQIASYPEGPHVVFYLVREGDIDIIGVPHQCMDVMNPF